MQDALLAGESLVLSYFVLVMYGDMIYSARMHVEGHAQILAAHGAALYMPAGVTSAPRRIPLFFEDLSKLNIGRPEVIAKATEHIQDMISYVSHTSVIFMTPLIL